VVGSSLNDCAAPFHIKESRTTDNEGACLSHLPVWLAGKEKNLHVGEGRSWVVGRVKSRVKTKLVQGVLQAVKCSLIRVPFFFLFK